MTYSWETNLPKSLQNPEDKAKIKLLTLQWSQIVAWSWSSVLAFKDDDSKASQELVLKKVLNDKFQQQGLNKIAYESYDDDNAKEVANIVSEQIKNIFLGNNPAVPELANIAVTLAEVYQKLSGQEFVPTKDPDFTNMFTFRVIPEYVGEFTEIGNREYIALIGYPPRPVLSEYTVTEQQLYDWANNINTQGNYLPPSLYIPIGGAC